MRKIVIICQAPADVQYLIDLYRRKQLRCDSIFVINVYNVFLFLQSLKLDDVRLYFIPYKLFSCKNVVNVIKERRDFLRSGNSIRTSSMIRIYISFQYMKIGLLDIY